MKRILAVVMVIFMLGLCGCSNFIPTNGTLELNANDIDHIRITNGASENSFSIAEREPISTIVKHLNSFTLENGTNPEAEGFSYRYCITLIDKTNGSAESHYYLADQETLVVDGAAYIVNAKDLLQFLEPLECKMLTDNELIDALLNENTLEQLNITDEEGKISIDKMIALPKTCPALFELMSRPSAVQSISTYGTDKIGALLDSADPELIKNAEEIITVLENLIPGIQGKLNELIENSKNN